MILFLILFNPFQTEICSMKQGKYLPLGIALGVALGTTLGVITDNLGLWMGVGIAIGAGLGTALSSLPPSEDDGKPKE